jgi:hypothetical protein
MSRLFVLGLACFACCSRPAAEPAPRTSYGSAMADVGRRFELLGRAANAGRFELAEYQLGEISEQFEDTLPRASPPKEGHPEALPPLALAFLRSEVPALRRALAARDPSQTAAAFEHVASACNACHQASGHGFIDIPGVAGRSVPSTDPVVP